MEPFPVQIAQVLYKDLPIKIYRTTSRPLFDVSHLAFLDLKLIQALAPHKKDFLDLVQEVVTESGIIELVRMSSNLEALAFELWIFTKVIPALRAGTLDELVEPKCSESKRGSAPAKGSPRALTISTSKISPRGSKGSPRSPTKGSPRSPRELPKYTYIFQIAPAEYIFGASDDAMSVVKRFTDLQYKPRFIKVWDVVPGAEALIEKYAEKLAIISTAQRSIITDDIQQIIRAVDAAIADTAERQKTNNSPARRHES